MLVATVPMVVPIASVLGTPVTMAVLNVLVIALYGTGMGTGLGRGLDPIDYLVHHQ